MACVLGRTTCIVGSCPGLQCDTKRWGLDGSGFMEAKEAPGNSHVLPRPSPVEALSGLGRESLCKVHYGKNQTKQRSIHLVGKNVNCHKDPFPVAQ